MELAHLIDITETALSGNPIAEADALAVLGSSDDELMAVVAAASRVRRHFFGRRVKVNYLVNLKSGLCPEDCAYCSQALTADSGVLRYSWLDDAQVAKVVEAGVRGGARRVCMVASGTGPSNREVERVAGMVEGIKADHPELEVCACLGFLKDEQADRLRTAGVDAYNHNLNTAESNYADICSTHTYADRVDTVERARGAGLSPCSGLIVGMGETPQELVEAVFALRDLGADSVPVNFLLPFDGTPLQGHHELTPQQCLRTLAMVRLVHPDTEVRAAAGREFHLRTLQPLALEIANSIFLGDYLTSEGQSGRGDLQMLADLGFEIEGGGDPKMLLADKVAIRRRGAGTPLQPNA